MLCWLLAVHTLPLYALIFTSSFSIQLRILTQLQPWVHEVYAYFYFPSPFLSRWTTNSGLLCLTFFYWLLWLNKLRPEKVWIFRENIQKTGSVIPHCLRGLVNTGAEPLRRCNPASFADLSAAWPSLVSHSGGVKKKTPHCCRPRRPLRILGKAEDHVGLPPPYWAD